ncbi:hypothetical protein [Streptomyces sp. NPDC050485]|uniref:hypothetical protein n=1 Tax=Streptomyces sp. NPDC050485 TaxID=3365617 RepID=UPI0037AA1831
MAEISYPFDRDTNIGKPEEGGGRAAVTQNDWQNLATQFADDRIDHVLNSGNMVAESMPFYAEVYDVNTIKVQRGEATVGGFYYKLDAPTTVRVEHNLDQKYDRQDLLVIRVDLAKGYGKVEVSQGAATANPQVPKVLKERGGRWELPLYVIRVPKKQGQPVISPVHPYKAPEDVSAVAPAQSVAAHQAEGSFIRNLAPSAGGGQYEAFAGADGFAITRDLGDTRTYTPEIRYTRVTPKGLVTRGRYRRIAPNLVWYSVDINNPTNTDYWNDAQDNCMAFTLPKDAQLHGANGQVFSGVMVNGGYDAGMPNFVDLRGYTWGGHKGDYVRMLYQNPKYLHEGLDYLRVFPRKSYILFSGVYETQGLK